MSERLRILYEGGEGELTVKKSRFIATTMPVHSEEDALAFIASIKKRYRDATHNCSAYTVGYDHELTHCSDDGEPSQTAGKPMLDVLLGEDIHDACVVVTRYFGGTLLGTGGLVRAYSDAVKEGLAQSVIVNSESGDILEVRSDYTDSGRIRYIAGQEGITMLDSTYAEDVTFTMLVPKEKTGFLEKKITEATAARASLSRTREVRFAIMGDEAVIL